MLQFLKEPLIHFLLIGALLFAAFELVNDQVDPEGKEIIVSQAKVDQLVGVFTRTWKRNPTAPELKALVDEHIREEILYREGVALGLDQNDTIVRRRIKQKFEFLAEDASESSEPSDEELSAFLKANYEKYEDAPHYTFLHVFINSESGEDKAVEALKTIDDSSDKSAWLDLGDPSLFESKYQNTSGFEIDRVFGHEFSRQFADLNSGAWQGPIASSYGFHLVYIESKIDGKKPKLNEVREAVLRDYQSNQRQKYLDQMYAELSKSYEISIEGSDGAEPILVQTASLEK